MTAFVSETVSDVVAVVVVSVVAYVVVTVLSADVTVPLVMLVSVTSVSLSAEQPAKIAKEKITAKIFFIKNPLYSKIL